MYNIHYYTLQKIVKNFMMILKQMSIILLQINHIRQKLLKYQQLEIAIHTKIKVNKKEDL